jgi:hypothetical protein
MFQGCPSLSLCNSTLRFIVHFSSNGNANLSSELGKTGKEGVVINFNTMSVPLLRLTEENRVEFQPGLLVLGST